MRVDCLLGVLFYICYLQRSEVCHSFSDVSIHVVLPHSCLPVLQGVRKHECVGFLVLSLTNCTFKHPKLVCEVLLGSNFLCPFSDFISCTEK